MWHTISLLLINHKREPPHSSPHFTSSYEFPTDENLFFWRKASEENEERHEVNGWAVLWERAAIQISAIRSTSEMMRQGEAGGAWYSWTVTIVVANNPETPVDERSFTAEEKTTGMKETWREVSVSISHHWKWNGCADYKTQSFNQQWNYRCYFLVVRLQMWPCWTAFPVLKHTEVSWDKRVIQNVRSGTGQRSGGFSVWGQCSRRGRFQSTFTRATLEQDTELTNVHIRSCDELVSHPGGVGGPDFSHMTPSLWPWKG